MPMHQLPQLRPIAPSDDPQMAAIIRAVMPEFGAGGPGFAIHDPEVDFMSRAYAAPRCHYLVLDLEGRLLGGGGVAPLEGGDADTAELRKMYFLPEARGHGLGELLARAVLDEARAFGFRRCYLETLTGMDAAQRLYARLGFVRRNSALGNTGHGGCDRWYELDLTTWDATRP